MSDPSAPGEALADGIGPGSGGGVADPRASPAGGPGDALTDPSAPPASAPRGGALVDQLGHYLPELREYIRRRSGAMLTARESASDLAQSVCREVIEHIDRFEHGDEEGFRRWLYRTAERKIINRYRYYTAEKRDVAREVADVVQFQGALLFQTPSRDAIAREELVRAEKAFGELPERYRVAIVLSRVKGLAHAEIAEHLGTSEGAVRNLVYRGLAAISERLAEGD